LGLLIDTNVILFGLLEPHKIKPAVQARLLDKNERLCVSVASIYEINFKAFLGKLALPTGFDVLEHVQSSDLEVLDIRPAHAAMAGQLPLTVRDPWDRMIVAQAKIERLSLISADSEIENLGIARIW
jgi:PIN domain nuclease of toxin-antitoxin system